MFTIAVNGDAITIDENQFKLILLAKELIDNTKIEEGETHVLKSRKTGTAEIEFCTGDYFITLDEYGE